MAREFVARWAMVDALTRDIEEVAAWDDEPASSHEIAEHLIEAGWRPGDDG